MRMTTAIFATVAFLVVATSFMSGIFGMAGGMVLMGALLLMLPVASAMVLQSAMQLTSNGWRAILWRGHTEWRIVGRFAIGATLAFGVFLAVQLVPSRGVVLLILGISPFVALVVPPRFAPQAEAKWGAEICGFVCQTLQFLSGVTGPILDIFFVRSTTMDRRKVVATKATCQVLGHGSRLIYFGGIMNQQTVTLHWLQWAILLGCAVAGTSLSRVVLERMSDQQFRKWTRGIVLSVASVYLVQGVASFL
ncbi:permease [Pigmentiphaga litoralis]|jgi:uncharacterized membrane protein YfcA|nr:permease [Pigmentiphaga litoralis]